MKIIDKVDFLVFQTTVSGDSACSPLTSAVCGSFAGAIAAALTTPLDVAKTRIILMQVVKKIQRIDEFRDDMFWLS